MDFENKIIFNAYPEHMQFVYTENCLDFKREKKKVEDTQLNVGKNRAYTTWI